MLNLLWYNPLLIDAAAVSYTNRIYFTKLCLCCLTRLIYLSFLFIYKEIIPSILKIRVCYAMPH